MSDERKRIVGQVVADVGGAFAAGLGYIGDRLGLFKLLARTGPATSGSLSEAAGLDERYTREWLKAMVSSGYVEYHSLDDRYSMTREQQAVLAEEDSAVFAAGAFEFALPSLLMTPRLMECFRDGGGIPYSELSGEIVESIDRMHRPWFDHLLTAEWLPSVPQLEDRLRSGIAALDVGCGLGRASVAIGRASPASRVVGIDPHGESIVRARNLAVEAQLSNVEFRATTLEDMRATERFDLVLAIDCIHDMPDPVGALQQIGRLLSEEGLLFWSEPTGSDNPMENRNATGKMRSALSPYHCLTVSLAEEGAGLGTIIGEAGARDLAREAGFTHFEKLPIKSAMQQFFLVTR